MAWWCSGRGVGFATHMVAVSTPGFQVATLGMLSATRASVTKQCNLVSVKGRWCPATGKVTVGLASDTSVVVYPPTGSRSEKGRWATVGRRNFPVAASLLCNSLPSDIQSSPSLPLFRQRLKTFLFRQSFPNIRSSSLTLLRLRGLRNSSANLVTLKLFWLTLTLTLTLPTFIGGMAHFTFVLSSYSQSSINDLFDLLPPPRKATTISRLRSALSYLFQWHVLPDTDHLYIMV